MNLQYITDASGNPQAVVVPIAEWTSIVERIRDFEKPAQTDDETDYLLSSPAMKKRLLEARARMNEPAKPWDEVKDALGI